MTLHFTRAHVGLFAAMAALLLIPLRAEDIKIDLGRETVGRTPVSFEPVMGSWIVAQDGPDKVIKVDGTAYSTTLDNASRLLLENARRFYGTSNEDLMDNAKQFAVFPIAILKAVDTFSNGTISVKFKTIAGNADRCSGILFNVKPNGDWLAVRYNDTENNIALWEFHNGVRRPVKFGPERTWMLARGEWHELKMTVSGADFTASVDGQPALEFTFGLEPGPGRGGRPPSPDLFPANNPVLRPPVAGKIGLWSKSDSTSAFKDYVVSPAK
jgi:hypothetical protein